MKVGLIGAGHIAEVHVSVVRAIPGAEIVAVSDRFPGYAEVFAREHDIANFFSSAKQMIEQMEPDIIHVLTPPATHYDVALECLELGCHVLVEKPMTLGPGEAQELIDAARRNQVLLTVDHNCRFEATIRRARQLIEEGAIGDVVAAEVDFGFDINRYPAILHEGAPESHWAYTELNGGPLQDQMPHPLSIVGEYLGEVEEVVTLSANRGTLPEPWSDEIRATIRGTRAQAEVYCSFSYKPDAMIFTARGTEGTVVANMYSMSCAVERQSPLPRGVQRLSAGFRRGVQELTSATGNVFRAVLGRLDTTNGVGPLVEGFYDAIREGTEPPVTATEGKQVVDLIHEIWPEPLRQELEAPGIQRGVGRRSATTLVTGGTGFVGSHLVQELVERGEAVRVLARPSSYGLGLLKESEADVDIEVGDLADYDAVRRAMDGIETVYHVGGAMDGGWETHRAATVTGTENVLHAAKETRPRRVVYYSSLVVYDVLRHRNGTQIIEDMPQHETPGRFGPYPRGKVAAEELVRRAQEEDDVSTTIIRPGIVIGPRGHVFFPHLGFKLKDRVFIIVRGGRLELPLIYIDNLVEGTIAAAHSDKTEGRAYNLVDDGRVTVRSYLERFQERTGLDTRILSIPFIVPYTAAGIYELVSGLGLIKKGATSRRQMRWKHKQVTFSNEAAKRDFGYNPSVSMDEALDRTFDWYMEQRR